MLEQISKVEKEPVTVAFPFLSRYRSSLLKLFLVICLLPFFLLSFFNHPVYDDFGNATKTVAYGFWAIQKELYFKWTGRYFSSLLLTVGNPLSYGWIGGFRLTPFIFLSTIWYGLYVICRWLTTGLSSTKYSIWFSGVLLLMYLCIMPNIFQGFYWYTGAAVYQVGNLLLVLVLVGSHKFLHSVSYTEKATWCLLCIVGAVAAAATNEVVLLQLLAGFGVCFLASIYQRSTAWRWWVCIGIVTFLAALVSLMAPGNFARMSVLQSANAHSLGYSAPRTLFSALSILSSIPVWSILLLLLLGWLPWGVRIAEAGHLSYLRFHPLLALAGLFGVVCVCYFPFWWLSASFTPVRTENAIVFFILLSWLLSIQATLNWYHHRQTSLPILPKWLHYYVVPIFGAIAVLRMGTVPATLELALNARKYNNHHNARYAFIEQQRSTGKRDVTVEPLLLKNKFSVLTDTTSGADITEHARDEQNRYYAAYFHLDSVRLRSQATPVANNK